MKKSILFFGFIIFSNFLYGFSEEFLPNLIPSELEGKLSSQCLAVIEYIDEQDNLFFQFIESKEDIISDLDEEYYDTEDLLVDDKFYVFTWGQLVLDEQGNIKNPLVHFNGGPGSSSSGTINMVNLLNRRGDLDEISFITLDQRGTGCSVTDFRGKSANALSSYGIKGIIYDAEVIRKLLLGEDSSWGILGQSFGGLLVRKYIEQAPEYLNFAFSHGYSITKNSYDFYIKRYTGMGVVNNYYFEEYPEDRERMKNISDSDYRVFGFTEETSITLSGLIDNLNLHLVSLESWSTIHSFIRYFDDLIFTYENLDIDSSFSEFFHEKANRYLGYFSFFSIAMAKQVDDSFYSSESYISNLVSQLSRFPEYEKPTLEDEKLYEFIYIRNIDHKVVPISEMRFSESMGLETNFTTSPEYTDEQLDFYNNFLEEWALLKNDYLDLDKIKVNLNDFPNLKFNIYLSEYDPIYLPTVISYELGVFGDLINEYIVLKNSGHEGYYTETQLWDDIKSQF